MATLVFVMLSTERLRALSWLGLALLPVLAVLPAANDLYSAFNDQGAAAAVGEMHSAARALAFTAAAGLVLGALAARNERYLPGLGTRTPAANRAVSLGLLGLGVVAILGFVIAVGNPISWIEDRATEFREAGSPDLSEEANRFTFNAGSNRADLWRVALDDFADDPLFGDGAGGFEYSYTLKRDADVDVRDAHSVELEHLSELGIVGLALFGLAIGGAVLGAIRARRLGPGAAGLSAVALASASYWLIHASFDWFWPYPAVTAPVMMLLGAACAPAVLTLTRPDSTRRRAWLVAGAAVLALALVPPFLSERYLNSAYDGWRDDLERAYSDLDTAGSLNPFADTPSLAEGFMARAVGDLPRARAAFGEAVNRRPEDWAAHYMLAVVESEEDPLLARNEARIALELNPLSPRVQALADALGVG